MSRPLFAHSIPGRPQEQWESLADHLMSVGARAASFAADFGFQGAAMAAGLLHDIGKASKEFQSYIGEPSEPAMRGPDHSTAGAREATELYGPALGKLIAFAIAGHHAGLANGLDLKRRLDPAKYDIRPYYDWRDHVSTLPTIESLGTAPNLTNSMDAGFTASFLTRMLFSCLVDADFLETERFYAQTQEPPIERGGFTPLPDLRRRLSKYMQETFSNVRDTRVNTARAQVLASVLRKAELPTGLFTLTVPTGGGKTLASLSFALDHALRYDLRRVVYVIPFTSIIEQTAETFRHALSTNDDILEHHSSFDWAPTGLDDEGQDGLHKLQRTAENWDAPIIVTTAVQFFESLFAARPSRCRKLHNLSNAVIILDEAQTMPVPLLRPSLAALDELGRNYGASIVLCTATQPAIRICDAAIIHNGRALGLDIPPERELAPDPPSLYRALKRVDVEVNSTPATDAEIAKSFAQNPQMLCIVNSRAHARTLFDTIRNMPGAAHLSTLMCPRHRKIKLADIRDRLSKGQPVRLVSTSLIEAGVDVDFPEVWRAASGLDAIAQAAGRCNREAKAESGRVVVFTPAEAKVPRAFTAPWQAALAALRRHSDALSLEAIHAYFQELYWVKGAEALDAALVDGKPGILRSLAERASDLDFDFKHIADAYRLIDDVMEPVIVPWKAHKDDHDSEDLLAKIAGSERPTRQDLRRLQLYTVGIPAKARAFWLTSGALSPVHLALGDALLRFGDDDCYDPETGLNLATPEQRKAENNVI